MCCLLDSCSLTQTKNQNIQITGRTVCTVPVVCNRMHGSVNGPPVHLRNP
jgi:hypothetical protein